MFVSLPIRRSLTDLAIDRSAKHTHGDMQVPDPQRKYGWIIDMGQSNRVSVRVCPPLDKP
ncbi:hypothetical protein THIX_90068 [Thiomonas sp. X19]|nr:hypothetical protein THIX_90068 [Thiomonas sp. X19]